MLSRLRLAGIGILFIILSPLAVLLSIAMGVLTIGIAAFSTSPSSPYPEMSGGKR